MEDTKSSTILKGSGSYTSDHPRSLKSWEQVARSEIKEWLTNEDYRDTITSHTLRKEPLGPFTKFLYYFAGTCEAPWGVMIDFNERKQRVFLPDHYYKWMHKLRDDIMEDNDKLQAQ